MFPSWLVGSNLGTINPLTFGIGAENQWGLYVSLSILIRGFKVILLFLLLIADYRVLQIYHHERTASLAQVLELQGLAIL